MVSTPGTSGNASGPLSVLVAGSSGFLGTHLTTALRERGHAVTSLVRSEPTDVHQVRWDPYAGQVPHDRVDAADVVVNLAGSPTAGNPHSEKWARELRESRVTTTRVLAQAISASPSPAAYLAGNGISWYGDHGDQVLTEASDTRGHGLLTDVSRVWQEAARPAQDAGARVCFLRTSPVMDAAAPPFKQLRLVFKAGLGARLGSGEQYMAMSSLRDWVGAVVHLAEHESASGPFNICLPTAPTNAEFTRALAKAVHRPALVAVPSPLIKVGAARMASELLNSYRTVPQALTDVGFEFADGDVDQLIATALA